MMGYYPTLHEKKGDCEVFTWIHKDVEGVHVKKIIKVDGEKVGEDSMLITFKDMEQMKKVLAEEE